MDNHERAEASFPDGPWAGYYVDPRSPGRHGMNLALRFRDGLVDGEGADGVGTFHIRGHFDARTLEVTWHKVYVTHGVYYRGFREGRGIWGTWDIGESVRGGFMIWPEGSTDGEHAQAHDEVAVPVSAVGRGPGAQPSGT